MQPKPKRAPSGYKRTELQLHEPAKESMYVYIQSDWSKYLNTRILEMLDNFVWYIVSKRDKYEGQQIV